MPAKLRAAVLGATGVAGQQFLTHLSGHPQFEVTHLAASERSAGKPYRAAIQREDGKVNWYAGAPLPEQFANIMVADVAHLSPGDVDIVFSALESDAAKKFEAKFAEKVPVLSTASAFRYEADVPILLPGVNLDQAELLRTQRQRRGWKGFVAPGPNCTTTGLAMTLAPLQANFGIEIVIMTSLQAVSGAGRSPGVLALDIVDNVVPFISGEEEKVERETQKILGTLQNGAIEAAKFAVSCTCTRVNVLEGHTESVFVGLKAAANLEQSKAALRSFGQDFIALNLPSAPQHLITVLDDPFRPQPRLDRDNEAGMTTTVGRLRMDAALRGVKYVLVSHNTKMGAAAGSVLVAEYLLHKSFI